MDGWHATVKVSALATVLMDGSAPLKPYDIAREGIRGLSMEQVQSAMTTLPRAREYRCWPALQGGMPGRTQVGRQRWRAACDPSRCPCGDEPLAGCDGATSIILFQMDVIHGLTLSEIHPDAVTTAYGPLADFITIARGDLSTERK